VHATVTVVSVDPAKARAVLTTVCRVRDTVVIEGEAQVMTTSRARREAKAAQMAQVAQARLRADP
jgi:3-hydroxybutyryl-CoA dehydratase